MQKLILFAFWAMALASDETCNQGEDACRPVPDKGSSLMQLRASRTITTVEEDGVSGATAWVAEDWGDCLVGCDDAKPLKFRKVGCRSVFNNQPVNDTDCDGPKPGNALPCDCSEGCTNTSASDCLSVEKPSGQQGKLYVPVGCFEFTRPADGPKADDPLRPTDCEEVEGEKPCMGGLPFFAFAGEDMDAGKCMRFCLSKALDIAGLDGGNTCRCGASLANQELFSHGPPRKSIVFRPDLLRRSTGCPLHVYRFKGPYEEEGIPDHFNDHMLKDLLYVDSIVAGSDLTEEQEEDGDPGNESGDALVESSSAEASPGFARKCWPGNCGPGYGPWKNRTKFPPLGKPDIWQEYVSIQYTWKAGTTTARKAVFREAAAEWRKHTCLNFIYVDKLTSYYGITVGEYDAKTCYLRGMGYTSSTINLGWCNNMRYRGSVIHEIGHALGMNHEQKRPDATKRYHGHGPFLRMYWQHIPSRWRSQYDPDYGSYTGSAYDGAGDPKSGYANYDFASIMHYDGGKRYDTYPPGKERLVGNRQRLSPGDLEEIRDLYQCRSAPAPTPVATPRPRFARLEVIVYRGQGLPNLDWGWFSASDPYVKMSYSTRWGRRSKHTEVVHGDHEPVWNSDVSFDGWDTASGLVFDVVDWDHWSDDDYMGRASVSAARILGLGGSVHALPLDRGGRLFVWIQATT